MMTTEKVTMMKNGEVLASGHPADVREVIEDMILEKLGFCPSLQESTDNEQYEVYLHTESYDECENEQLEQLDKLRITDDPKLATEAIKRFLQVEFELIQN